jgi:general nucleoside transport system ATP-binding protein
VDSHPRAYRALTPDTPVTSPELLEAPDLDLHDVTRRFGNVIALDQASFTVRKRSIHALLGENGAGKTTLMRIAFGLIKPDSGSIHVKGKRASFASPADAIAAGIGMVHQQFSLVPEMTVAENVALGGRGRFNAREVARRIDLIGNRMGMHLDPFAKVAVLTSSERQKLEIVRTFAHDATILILDEPTAVLTPKDIGDLFSQLRAFASAGGSVVLITHKLRDAIENADEVTVLRRGRCVLSSPMHLVNQEILAGAMLGSTAIVPLRAKRPMRTNVAVVLDLQNVSFQDERRIERLRNVSLQVVQGEILGVAALEGAAGHLLRIMADRLEPTSGIIKRPSTIGFVPEDRPDEAIIPELTLPENMALANASSRTGTIDWQDITEQAERTVQSFDVKAPGMSAPMTALSGGNQQKFVLGRELKDRPALLVLENPAQGLDVHAAEAIHERLRAAADAGTAVVIYSSDLDELASISDRIVVVNRGGIASTSANRDAIGSLLLETAG